MLRSGGTMQEYEMNIVMTLKAESKMEAADIIKEMFQDISPLDFSEDVDGDLFAEMGISYD